MNLICEKKLHCFMYNDHRLGALYVVIQRYQCGQTEDTDQVITEQNNQILSVYYCCMSMRNALDWERIPELTASQNLMANHGWHHSLSWAMRATNTISLQSNVLTQYNLMKNQVRYETKDTGKTRGYGRLSICQ
jgi:hypothetical protein